MKEKAIVRDIIKTLRAREGCFVEKSHGSMYSGAGRPDLIGCDRGRYFAFEAKVPGEKPTPIQARALEAVRQAGGIAGVVTSVDEALELLEGT